MSVQIAEKDSVIEIGREQLPLCCPQQGDEAWNMHPRVFISFGGSDEAVCPYCGARYLLKD